MFKDKVKAIMFSIPKIELILITLFAITLIFLPMAVKGASNSTNGTGFQQTSSIWVERANLSLPTSLDGWVTVIGTIETKTNYSSSVLNPQGRLKKNGVVIYQVNLTQQTYLSNSVILGVVYVTAGTNYFAIETYVPAGQKLTAYNWTFVVTPDSGGGISSVSGLPAGVLDCTPGETPVCTINITGADFRNDTSTLNSVAITALSSYINATFINGTAAINLSNATGILPSGSYGTGISKANISDYDSHDNIFKNISVYGETVLTSFVRFIAGNGILLNQTETNITISDTGTNATVTSHVSATGTAVHGLGNASLLNIPFNDSVLQNGSLFIKNDNTSYVLTSNNSYVKTDNVSYVLVTNTSYVKTDNASYVLITNTSYVLTNNASYVLVSNLSYVLTNNASYALYSNLTYPRIAVSNGSSGNLTYNQATGVFNLNTVICSNATTSKLLSDGTNITCGTDQTSSFSIRSNANPLITGSATLLEGNGVSLTQSGNTITINAPAGTLTNETVNPHSMNATNITSGLMEYVRIRNVSVDLASNVTGTLSDMYIESSTVWNAKVDTVAGSDGITVTESPANTYTVSYVNGGNISGTIPLDNGIDPIETGLYPSLGLIPVNGTIARVSMIGGDTGAINISLVCNATSNPVYPQDSIATLTTNPETNTTVSHAVIQYGWCGAYVNSNSGGVTKTNFAFIIRRV